MTKKKPVSEYKPRGRKQTRIVKLDTTPDEAARALFCAAKPPNPSLRKAVRKTPSASTA